jgi:hypothetical protein
MFQENEIVMLVIGLGTLMFIYFNHHQLKRLPSSGLLLGSFYVFSTGWLFTVLEGFFLGNVLNYLEHISYAASSILLVIWCRRTFHSRQNPS